MSGTKTAPAARVLHEIRVTETARIPRASTPPKLSRGTQATRTARKRNVASHVRQVLSTALVVRMEDLQYADMVAVGNGAHPDVFFFGHRGSHPVSEFVSIQHAGSQTPLRLSPGHYLYVDCKLRTARSVRLGDQLRGADGEYDVFVLNVKREQLRGLYAPTPVHGDLVVDGVVCPATPTSCTRAWCTGCSIPSAFCTDMGSTWSCSASRRCTKQASPTCCGRWAFPMDRRLLTIRFARDCKVRGVARLTEQGDEFMCLELRIDVRAARRKWLRCRGSSSSWADRKISAISPCRRLMSSGPSNCASSAVDGMSLWDNSSPPWVGWRGGG